MSKGLWFFVLAWLFCPILGADIGLGISLARSALAADVALLIAVLLIAVPVAALHYLLYRLGQWSLKLPRT